MKQYITGNLHTHEGSFCFQYGTVFETILATTGIITGLELHIERLQSSSDLLHLMPPPIQQMKAGLANIPKTGTQRINIFWDGTYWSIWSTPLQPLLKQEYSMGVSVNTMFWTRSKPLAKYKSMLYQYAPITRNEQEWETLLLSPNNEITEGSISNIFAVKNHQILTPKTETCLGGTMRKRVLLYCQKHSIPTAQTTLSLDDVGTYDQLFLTNSLRGIIPIKSIRDNKWVPKNGSLIITKLQMALQEKAI